MSNLVLRRVMLSALLCLCAAPAGASAGVGPDYVSSDNVELVERIRTVGDGVGARIVGDYLYVTSTKGLQIFDIKTDPEHPREVGVQTLDVEFENEEVPTNGRLLGISGQIGCKDLTNSNIFNPGSTDTDEATGCLSLYDVSDPSNVTFIRSVAGAGQHTSTCLYDCKWFYGSTGAITDAQDPASAKVIGDWHEAFPTDYFKASCHHVRELTPGVVLGSCQPFLLLSTRPEDGGTVTKPVALAAGTNEDERFIHSSRWPRDGADRFVLSGGETNASPSCDDTVGAFMVWDAGSAVNPLGGFYKGATFKILDEIRPTNGSYLDGHTPVNGLGCSVHWFHEHPTFRNGGLVALAEYENGTRFLKITAEGKIEEVGFFLPLAGSTSAPHWNPNGKVVYAIDYTRGVDVLRYTGETYVPDPKSTAGASCKLETGFVSATAAPAGRGLRFDVERRQSKAFDVEVVEAGRGKAVTGRRIARFRNKKAGFRWNGRRAKDGTYFARFTMRLEDKLTDTRFVTLTRARGRFKAAPAHAQPSRCGLLSDYSLSSPVFGGRRKAPLKISYRLARGADGVIVEAKVGDKVVKRFERKEAIAGKAYSFSLPARLVPRGKTVTIQTTVVQSAPVLVEPLTAKRL